LFYQGFYIKEFGFGNADVIDRDLQNEPPRVPEWVIFFIGLGLGLALPFFVIAGYFLAPPLGTLAWERWFITFPVFRFFSFMFFQVWLWGIVRAVVFVFNIPVLLAVVFVVPFNFCRFCAPLQITLICTKMHINYVYILETSISGMFSSPFAVTY
jgi:hypothetical protein